MSHACACGAPLPDRRAKFCATCRGARVKEQDLARSKSLKERVWWLLFANALKVEARFRFCIVDDFERAARCIGKGAGVSPLTVQHAMEERSISPRDFHSLCKWL